jgi:thiaminase/transcriptional activator TenA
MVIITFSDALRQHSIETWNKILNHSFITEISMDVLLLDRFTFYLKQDNIFLQEFCNFLQVAKEKSNSPKVREWFEELIFSTINFEMQMQTQILNMLGISSSETNLEGIFPSTTTTTTTTTTTLNYTSYLRKISLTGSMGEIVSAMAPCPWTYFEIAEKLSKSYIQREIYKKWIQFYSSKQSYRQVKEIKMMLDALSKEASKKEKIAMKNSFATACKYECLFWDMAYNFCSKI